jgi:2-desacetyl-2-hydroxyethyl bacteriochlorophyllide A dehydrogenase
MRSLICDRPGQLSLIDRPEPVRGTDEVMIRIRRVGVCGTDFHIFQGKHPFLQYPRVMGHELAGEVVEAPAGSALRPGQPVYVVPYLSCGHCRACRKGLTNCCRAISVLGVHRDGGMAEFLSVPERNVVAADGIGLDAAAMIEFLAIGAHGIRRGAVGEADRVLVVGAGPIGLSAMIFARARGAHVTALDTREDRLRFATDTIGVQAAVMVSPSLDEELAAATDGEFFDVVVDATGNIGSMQRGLGFVGHGGRYVLLSIVHDDLTFSDPELHKRETTLLASRNALPEDFAEVVSVMRAGGVPSQALNTHRASIADAGKQFAHWMTPQAGVIKAIIEI